ncbi:MAG: IS200/IS605 family transposase [Christensenellales bacterium]
MHEQNNITKSLAHTKWNCKYHIVFAPKYRRKVFYEEKRLEIREILRKLCQWKGVEVIEGEICPEHICGHSRENTAAIKAYIANQLKQDEESDQLTLFDPIDPFKGSK